MIRRDFGFLKTHLGKEVDWTGRFFGDFLRKTVMSVYRYSIDFEENFVKKSI